MANSYNIEDLGTFITFKKNREMTRVTQPMREMRSL